MQYQVAVESDIDKFKFPSKSRYAKRSCLGTRNSIVPEDNRLNINIFFIYLYIRANKRG